MMYQKDQDKQKSLLAKSAIDYLEKGMVLGLGTGSTIDLFILELSKFENLFSSLKIVATSKEHGEVPTWNTLAEIKGVEKPDEYVILSAHFDSWDGGTGTTDNGTGTIVMMEAMRILKKFYPNPKRTIMVGHWGSEEQGLNGSRAFVEDYPKIVENTQAVFNQDNGTGRVVNLSGQGFLHSYEYISNWLSAVPQNVTKHIETDFPGMPGGCLLYTSDAADD